MIKKCTIALISLCWLIWFVPTQQYTHMVWFDQFMRRLHEGSQSVIGLLEHNPFAEEPPKYLRVMVYRYRFTTPQEREESGEWWRREALGLFPRTPPRRP